jgi:hypothetical protein
MASESTKRAPIDPIKRKSRKRATKREPSGPPPLPPDEVRSLRDFIKDVIGHDRLTWWEAGFINDRKYLIYLSEDQLRTQAVWLTDKQQVIVRQIKDKLHYERPQVPLPPIDPDGIEENDDPDGWPTTRPPTDPFEDDT